jgi:hypothetical protein
MKVDKKFWISLILIIPTLLAACSPASPEAQGDQTDSPPEAVAQAREVLAEELNVGVDEVIIQSFERQDWSDSCLGLGGPAESCLAVITPGWQVIMVVGDSEPYEVRTDETGEVVRINQ